MTFNEFFQHVWGYQPFPWQSRLADQVCTSGWPDVLDLPTGTGKTAVLDIAVYAMYRQEDPEWIRVAYVVDRRTVVDQTYDRMKYIQKRILENPMLSVVRDRLEQICGPDQDPENPLEVSHMRGGVEKNMRWAEYPHKPAVVISTVDQVGSRLLFRGYGENRKKWPIHAGLLSQKTLHLLDEVHLSGAYRETLRSIERNSDWGANIRVVEMSATPSGSNQNVFTLGDDDRCHPVLSLRVSNTKNVKVVSSLVSKVVEIPTGVVRESTALVDSVLKAGHNVVAVVVNRIHTAQTLYEKVLKAMGNKKAAKADVLLLTSRIRGVDRAELEKTIVDRARSGRDRSKDTPLVVISTQCIEAGADFDFDAIITELASLDALIQRFGRMDRLGQYSGAEGYIISPVTDGSFELEDPIYGEAYTKTAEFLLQHKVIDFNAINKASAAGCFRTVTTAPELTDEIVSRWFCTTSKSSIETYLHPVHWFLHGKDSGVAEINVVWRSHLDVDEGDVTTLKKCPPVNGESMSLPIGLVRSWLKRSVKGMKAEVVSDVEGGASTDGSEKDAACNPFVAWMGDASFIGRSDKDLVPGMTIVVPASYGGIDPDTKQFWVLSFKEDEIDDVYLDACFNSKKAPVIRVKTLDTLEYDEAQTSRENLRLATPVVSELIARFDGACPKEWLPVEDVIITQFKKSTRKSCAVLLDDHLKDVAGAATTFAKLCGLNEHDFYMAGLFHDLGKSDYRFQKWLGDGSIPVLPLAKSGKYLAPSRRAAAGLPKGYQHATTSYALILEGEKQNPSFFQGADREKTLHLVLTHHGWCRPFPPECDEIVIDVEYEDLQIKTDPNMYKMDSEVSEHFLNYMVGRKIWEVVYEEAIFRLADHEGSRKGNLRAEQELNQ